ncbi:MAG: EpsG family protein [Clostridia bacterium]
MFFIYIFKSTRVNPLLLIFISIVFNYVAIGNQIRFYLAFPLVLLAFFELVTKRYVLTVLLFIIAILEHKSVIILFAVLVVFKFLVYRLSLKKQMLLILLANIIIFFLLNFSDSFDEKYDDYQSAGNISSLAGGIFNVVPYLLPIYSCVRISKILGKKAPELKDKPIYEFLYTCSIAPMVFLMSGLYVKFYKRFKLHFFNLVRFFIYVHRHPLQKN